jgi:predicted MFS family arabinose efflux permease
MIAARFLAGAFAGPATSLALSIVADVVPPQRRGQAMSKVMGAFAIASSLGVPLGLRLARFQGWRSPFLVVAGLGVVILALAGSRLPTLRGHLVNQPKTTAFQRMRELVVDGTVQLALVMNVFVFIAAFLVIPHISAYLQQDLGYPRERLEWAYVVGGVTSIFVLAFTGRAVDKRGPAFVASWGTLVFWVALVFGFIAPNRFFHLPTFALFAIFMGGMSMRNISLGSLATRVPRPHERAGFMSLQSVAQQLSMGLGSVISTAMLHNTADGKLAGIPTVSAVSLVLGAALPPMLMVITRRVRAREAIATVAASQQPSAA